MGGSRDALQAEAVDPAVRKAVEQASVELGYRVTAGDVAARAGVSVDTSAQALNAIASDASGSLEVSPTGELVYAFPQDFRSELQRRSLKLRMEPAVEKAKGAGAYLVRISFGTALIVSVVAVWVGIYAILNSSRSSNDDRRDNGGGGGMFVTRGFMNFSDIWWFYDPYYYSRPRDRDGQMSFLESIFSFVFGDGNPNSDFDSARWTQLGRYIASKGGVVTAEEMAPFLIPADGSIDELPEDESYVLPALVRFGGDPEVGADGQILYRFRSMQVTAAGGAADEGDGGWRFSDWIGGGNRRQQQQTAEVPLEQPVPFTAASSGQSVGTVALGILNLVGVSYLSALLGTTSAAALGMTQASFAAATGLLPFLQAYAVSFFAIPLVRAVLNALRNARIEKRNESRMNAADSVNSPSAALQKKLLSARAQAKTEVLEEKDSIFRSDREASDQGYDPAAEEFDRKLKEL